MGPALVQPEAGASSGVRVLVGLLAALFTLQASASLHGEWRDVWVPSLFEMCSRPHQLRCSCRNLVTILVGRTTTPSPKTSTPCPESREHLTSHVDSSWACVTKPGSRDGRGCWVSQGPFSSRGLCKSQGETGRGRGAHSDGGGRGQAPLEAGKGRTRFSLGAPTREQLCPQLGFRPLTSTTVG